MSATRSPVEILCGDALATLRALPAGIAHTCVTSPPYWGLRDYGMDGQIGQESTPEAFVARLVDVLLEVRRVLRPDGTLWLNLGDTYAPNRIAGLKPKDLVGIPWRVAFALQADGWWLRSDIVWSKPAPMPESVRDRPTRSHEYLFLLAASEHYVFDAEAFKEPCRYGDVSSAGEHYHPPGAVAPHTGLRNRGKDNVLNVSGMRNRRTVWSVASTPFREAHFATMPEGLVTPCVLAAAPEGGACLACGSPRRRGSTVAWEPICSCNAGFEPCLVLVPFCGSGTVGVVAQHLGRNFIGIDLNPDYVEMAQARIARAQPGLRFAEVPRV